MALSPPLLCLTSSVHAPHAVASLLRGCSVSSSSFAARCATCSSAIAAPLPGVHPAGRRAVAPFMLAEHRLRLLSAADSRGCCSAGVSAADPFGVHGQSHASESAPARGRACALKLRAASCKLHLQDARHTHAAHSSQVAAEHATAAAGLAGWEAGGSKNCSIHAASKRAPRVLGALPTLSEPRVDAARCPPAARGEPGQRV